MNVYVSPQGSDRNPGTRARPLRTLEAARNAVRVLRKNAPPTKGGVTIWLAGGVYERVKSFALSAQDSGTKASPVVYRAMKGETARLRGGREIPASAFGSVTDPAVRKRFDPAARAKVVQADLKAQGITDYGDPVALGRRPELFLDDEAMTLARWPNDGFTTIHKVLGLKPEVSHGIKGDKVGVLVYKGARPKRWVNEDDLRLHGYWFWD